MEKTPCCHNLFDVGHYEENLIDLLFVFLFVLFPETNYLLMNASGCTSTVTANVFKVGMLTKRFYLVAVVQANSATWLYVPVCLVDIVQTTRVVFLCKHHLSSGKTCVT